MSDYNAFQSEHRLSKLAWAVIIIVLLLVLSAVGFVVWRRQAVFADPASSGYEAVFLTNGQVYFGKLGGQDSTYLVLKDIYYLQANQSLQGATTTGQQPFSLVKLGKELHGPTDMMFINRSQVLFYENLRADSPVVKSIQTYMSGTSAN